LDRGDTEVPRGGLAAGADSTLIEGRLSGCRQAGLAGEVGEQPDGFHAAGVEDEPPLDAAPVARADGGGYLRGTLVDRGRSDDQGQTGAGRRSVVVGMPQRHAPGLVVEVDDVLFERLMPQDAVQRAADVGRHPRQGSGHQRHGPGRRARDVDGDGLLDWRDEHARSGLLDDVRFARGQSEVGGDGGVEHLACRASSVIVASDW